MENESIVKYLLVLLAAPLWWPVLKALWVEANRMLVEDGGVLGRPPVGKEMEARKRELAELEDPLVHEPFTTEDERRSARRQLGSARRARPGGAAQPGQAGQAGRALRPGPRRPGFR